MPSEPGSPTSKRRAGPVVGLLLEESASLGLRISRVERRTLERWSETRETDFGSVRYEVARLPSGAVVSRVEDAELRRLAASTGPTRRALRARLERG